MNHRSERACTAHQHLVPIEAERVVEMGINYIVLRCPQCNRPQGLRWVPRRTIVTVEDAS